MQLSVRAPRSRRGTVVAKAVGMKSNTRQTIRPLVRLGQVSFALLLSVAACKSKAKDATGSAAGSDSPSEPAPALPPVPVVPATPGVLNVAGVPALAAPDAIEPPSRDIVPGMTIAAAKAKGCKDDSVDYLLKWKDDVDVWVDKDSGLVTKLAVTYKKADFEQLKTKWGAPSFGEDWLGANWLASLSGCTDTCTVNFTRSPLALLGAQPAPPLGLAGLKPGATVAAVTGMVGADLKGRNGVGSGFGLDVGIDPDSDSFGVIVLNEPTNRPIEEWRPLLEKQWGPAVKSEGSEVSARWISQDKRWAVELGRYGDTLRYIPMMPSQELFATLRALPAKVWNKPKAVVDALPGFEDGGIDFPHTELSVDSANYRSVRFSVEYDDKDTVSEIRIAIFGLPAQLKAAHTAWQALAGSPKKTKNADGDEQQTATVDGITFVVALSDEVIEWLAVRPEPAQP